MRSEALEDLFISELEELYDAEKQIYKGLTGMAKKAVDSDLKSAFVTHQKETKDHIRRLEQSFKALDESPRRGSATGVNGLIKQANEMMSHSKDPSVTDAALIAAGQKIEHYEMAAYGCVRTHAGILGYKQIEELMSATLKEEEETDKLLSEIADKSVNPHAAAAPYARARTGQRHDGRDYSSDSRKMSLGTMAVGLAIGGALSLLIKSPAAPSRPKPEVQPATPTVY